MKSAKRLNRKLVKSRLTKKRRQVSSGGGLERSKTMAIKRKASTVKTDVKAAEPTYDLASERSNLNNGPPVSRGSNPKPVQPESPIYNIAASSNATSSPIYNIAASTPVVGAEEIHAELPGRYYINKLAGLRKQKPPS